MSANSGSIGSRNGTLAELSSSSKNEAQTATAAAVAALPSAMPGQKKAALYRSRTDSAITYTPPSIGEAPGSTLYIRKNGQMDYLVLLKVILPALLPFEN